VTPILSILIVAYRSREEIGPNLASLPRQLLGRPVEVVVVDNSPGDGTGALIAERFPGVTYIDPGTNLGFGRGNNLAFARSSGECVLYLNPDTVMDPAALEHCVRRVLAEPDLGLSRPACGRPTAGWTWPAAAPFRRSGTVSAGRPGWRRDFRR
jgi:N-acetylglucosaminyl-diphospho-decaprenol L-rhamnosyltransferase